MSDAVRRGGIAKYIGANSEIQFLALVTGLLMLISKSIFCQVV